MPEKHVTVGGQEYVISGIMFGTRPAWDLISRAGKPIGREAFLALPDVDKQELASHVQQYLDELNTKR